MRNPGFPGSPIGQQHTVARRNSTGGGTCGGATWTGFGGVLIGTTTEISESFGKSVSGFSERLETLGSLATIAGNVIFGARGT